MIYYCSYTRLKKYGATLHVSYESEPPAKFITNEITTLDAENGCEFHGHIEAKDLDHAFMVFKAQLLIQHKVQLV